MWLIKSCVLALTLVSIQTMALAQLYIYPKQNQTATQLEKDKYYCYSLAENTTGITAANIVRPSGNKVIKEPVKDNPHRGGAAKGQAIGTVTGAIIGHNNHHTVGGAIVGAVVGEIIGSAIENEGEAQQRQEARDSAKEKAMAQAVERAEYHEKVNIFNAEFARCLTARGYVAK